MITIYVGGGINKHEYEHSTSNLITIQYKRHLYYQNKKIE
jgi:hypothetical protein